MVNWLPDIPLLWSGPTETPPFGLLLFAAEKEFFSVLGWKEEFVHHLALQSHQDEAHC